MCGFACCCDKLVAVDVTCKHVQKCTIIAINTLLSIILSLQPQIILKP